MTALLCSLLFAPGLSPVPRFVPSQQDNMNGEYPLSSTPGGKLGLMPKRFADYPGGVESFDVLSPPMTTLYSQVWWKPLPPVDLPADIVRRYNGSAMAIVGWEVDQVRVTPEGEMHSVPMSASYNHHWDSWMIGSDARFRKLTLDGPDDPRAARLAEQRSGCGGNVPWDQPQYVIEGAKRSARGHPTSAALTSGNGGEFRKTLHGFAPGYALVVDSPTQLQITPMNIDTWNRAKMDISQPLPPKFVPGPEPRASLAIKGAAHSGLLECPMTTRLTKVVDSATYVGVSNGTCAEPIYTFYECWQAAEALLPSGTGFVKDVGTYADLPPGCSIHKAVAPATRLRVVFNEAVSTTVACSETAQCACPDAPTPFGAATGALLYHQTSQPADIGIGKAARFERKCRPWPATTLLEQRNPTCDIRYYRGGQWACNHMWSLLDADQQIPWDNQPLTFHHKYRFHVSPHRADSLTPAARAPNELLIGSPWEYDVPQCKDGVPGCSQEADGLWVHTISGSMMGEQGKMVHLNAHCHAPTCLSTALYACAKDTPLDQCNATVGKLICESRPVYGGTGAPSIAGGKFDEPGYIALADCLWGSAEYGLEPPVNLTGVPLHIVKRTNATYGHYGEMSGTRTWGIQGK